MMHGTDTRMILLAMPGTDGGYAAISTARENSSAYWAGASATPTAATPGWCPYAMSAYGYAMWGTELRYGATRSVWYQGLLVACHARSLRYRLCPIAPYATQYWAFCSTVQ
eukprot:2101511-Rhodomonas_salina.3